MSQDKPGHPQQPGSENDKDAIAFAEGIFDLARNGGTSMLTPLLAAGVPVTIRTSHGESLLMLAVANGHLDTARLLLEKGVDPDLADAEQRTPLMAAAMQNNVDMVQCLLKAGADRTAVDADGKTALSLAKEAGAEDVLPLLED